MCDSMVATGAHTLSGDTLFAKNSDRKSEECQPFVQFPGALCARGAVVECTHISIPQVAETYRVMGHSPWWVWGFEHGVNEHGVAIGNQSIFSCEPVEEEPGLIGMDLVRLGLERGRTGREALEVIATLLETFGQGGAALAPGAAGYHNSFMIADPQQAWLLETSGRRWAARPVDLEALSNHVTLGTDWAIGSRDLESFARDEGWWREPGRLDVAEAYRNPNVLGCISEGRLRRSRELLHDGRGRLCPESMMVALRDHGEGRVAPPRGLAPDDESYYSLCMHSEPVGTTTASMTASLPEDRSAPWPVWISFGTPCTGIFMPVYLDGQLPAVLAAGSGEPQAEPVEESAWWLFHRLHEAAAEDFEYFTPMLREGWAPLEERIDYERRNVESRARTEVAAGDRDEAALLISEFMQRTLAEIQDRAAELLQAVRTSDRTSRRTERALLK
jgi:secernin